MSYYDQSGFGIRGEWGRHALEHLAPAEIVVIVDILSFSTCVEIATFRGAKVFPCPWKDEVAVAYAKEKQAELASKRNRPDGSYSLSPSSLIKVSASLRLVLPSPNGSDLAFAARARGAIVAAGCLRNASALGSWLEATGKSVSVIPAGERWPDGSLRYAIEDLIGAGAILRELRGPMSPEARLAIAAFKSSEGALLETLLQSTSGRELMERGFRSDVELAAELDAASTIPILRDDCFQAHGVPPK